MVRGRGRVAARRRVYKSGASPVSHPPTPPHPLPGTTCSDYQITGLLLGTLFAGQHTSSISSTWTVLNLLHSPKHLATAMAEQLAVAGPTPGDNSKLDFESVGRMDFLHLAMKESLRMAPPLIMMMRAVHVPLNVGKHVVPVGHYVFTSPAVSMNLPNSASDCAFPDAEVFSPERHLKAPAKPFSYIAFGGGGARLLGGAVWVHAGEWGGGRKGME